MDVDRSDLPGAGPRVPSTSSRARGHVLVRRGVPALAVLTATALAVPSTASASVPIPRVDSRSLTAISDALSARPSGARLTRAPYLTDLTSSSVTVTWATARPDPGAVQYGPLGACTAHRAPARAPGTRITVGGISEYVSTVTITGLSARTGYCYRITSGFSGAEDLLAGERSPAFTTLDAAPAAGGNSGGGKGSAALTFDVLGDWGDTTDGGINSGSVNPQQAALDAQLAASHARFVVSTGDVAGPGGSQTSYGDLQQAGMDVSGVFGPSYWATPGRSLPLFAALGDRDQDGAALLNWPQPAVVAASSGSYQLTDYSSVAGAAATGIPTGYYAFTAGGVRMYVLDAAWSGTQAGTADGAGCGTACAAYRLDRDAHWTAGSAEYQWLAADLAAHPGQLKFAFFHYPLRSDDPTAPGDTFLQTGSGSARSEQGTAGAGTLPLERLLADGGVKLVFNGHGHGYQRNVAPPGGVISYVTAGGGSGVGPVGGDGCASTDAYAIGWSYLRGSGTGSGCGSAPVPRRDSQVFHFLKVTVSGSRVTVTPIDASGRTFDRQSYDFSADRTPPTMPGAPAVAPPGSGGVVVTWKPASDNVALAGYDVYRDGGYLGTVPSGVHRYVDTAAGAGPAHGYQVRARDLAGNQSAPARAGAATGPDPAAGTRDTEPPTAPPGFRLRSYGVTTLRLGWQPATDNVGVAGYVVRRGGAQVAVLPATARGWQDRALLPGSSHTYSVAAYDSAGNLSPASPPITVTTRVDSLPPVLSGTPVIRRLTSGNVELGWPAARDNVGVFRYEVLRNGLRLGTAATNRFTDTSAVPGASYTYLIRAFDAAGNFTTGAPVTVSVPRAAALCFDGFEPDQEVPWLGRGVALQEGVVHTGRYAARATSAGGAAFAYRSVPGSPGEVWAQAWVDVLDRSGAVDLLSLRTATGTPIASAGLDATGRVVVRTGAGRVATGVALLPALGNWHRLVLHVRAAGGAGAGQAEVFVDGQRLAGIGLTGQQPEAAPIGQLLLGDTGTGRAFDLAVDDIRVSTEPL